MRYSEIGAKVTVKKKAKKVIKKTTAKKKVAKKVTSKKPTAKKEVGRPTKYDPAFCEMVIEVMKKGYSKEAVAGHLGICKDTLYQWADKHKEFSDAIKVGLEFSRLHWEKLALENITHTKAGKQLNSVVWLFNMKNRFGWADKIETKNEDTTDKPKKTFAFSLDAEPAIDDE